MIKSDVWIRRLHVLSLCISLLLVFSNIRADDALAPNLTVSSSKSFEDVMFDLEFAITQSNFAITNEFHIGKSIAKRNDIDFPHLTAVQFCNLEMARKFLEIDPGYVEYMPCKIVIFETEGGIQIQTHLLPEDDTKIGNLSAELNEHLREILDIAAN